MGRRYIHSLYLLYASMYLWTITFMCYACAEYSLEVFILLWSCTGQKFFIITLNLSRDCLQHIAFSHFAHLPFDQQTYAKSLKLSGIYISLRLMNALHYIFGYITCYDMNMCMHYIVYRKIYTPDHISSLLFSYEYRLLFQNSQGRAPTNQKRWRRRWGGCQV